ncbi:MAG TPA: hypothetical protein VH639_05650 [Bryobacteraceae bacterium]|jgi:hypothetical protein
MKIEYLLPAIPARSSRTEIQTPERVPYSRPPRVACLLALAHRFEQLVRSGEVRDYAEIARLGRVSRARMSQILRLLTLAPSIQEYLLFLAPRGSGDEQITERDLRPVVREPLWDRQCELFERLLRLTGAPQAEPPPDP